MKSLEALTSKNYLMGLFSGILLIMTPILCYKYADTANNFQEKTAYDKDEVVVKIVRTSKKPRLL